MPSIDYDPHDDADTDLFALLGVQWGAEQDGVRQAWRDASRAAHPDAGGSHDAFIALQHAWEVLSDPSRRTRYIRAYEARHGPQGRRDSSRAGSRTRSPGGANARGRGTGASRRSARRCTGTTVTGSRCANPAAEGRDRCWLHVVDVADGPASASGPSASSTTPPEDAALPYRWRCRADVFYGGTRLRCHYPSLIGQDHCWDHAAEAERQDAMARARPGRCASLTQRDIPCRNPSSSLGFPLCDTHLTVGVFDTSEWGRPSSGRRPPPAGEPDTSTEGTAETDGTPPPRSGPSAPPPDPPPTPPHAPRPRAEPGRRTAPQAHPVSRPAPPARRVSRHLLALVVALASLGAIYGLSAAVIAWSGRPRTISFADDIKASRADCASVEKVEADDLVVGLVLTCTMADAAPGNRDRPYVQLRLEGCDDWTRLDHDDGDDPVVLTTWLRPCGEPPGSVQWQVCQTHGGPLPDDCADGSSRFPAV